MEVRLTALVALFVLFAAVHAGPRRHANIQQRPQQQPQQLNNVYGSQETENYMERLLKDLCPQIKDEVSKEVPAKFAELVNTLSSLSHASISRLDRKVKDGNFCSSKKLQDFWSDALIMDASEGSLKLMAGQIIRKEVSQARANYLLTMMAFAKKPTSGSVRAVLPILEKNDIPRQGLLGISALIQNYWSANGYEKTPEIKDAIKAIAKYMEKNSKHDDRVIVALKALQNIQAIEDVQDEVLAFATDKSHKTAVRVAAIESLRGISHPTIRVKCQAIFEKGIESSEVRIAAYKLLVERADQQTIQKILNILMNEDNKQVGSFVVSHLKNIQESSSPRLQTVRNYLMNERIPSDRFPQDMRKYSRNIELSRYVEKLGVGAVFESDIIFDRTFAPRSFKVNMTLPVQDNEINVLEVGFRQVGLDHQIRKLAGPEGLLNGQNFPEVISELMEFMMEGDDQESVNEIGRRHPRSVQSARSSSRSSSRSRVAQKYQANDENVEGSMYITLGGKTIAYLDVQDFSNPESDMSELAKSLKEMMKRSNFQTDSAFSFMFLNKKFEREGKTPVSMNGTIVMGLKSDKTGFWPSFAAEISTRTPEKKLVQRIASSPAIKFNKDSKKITLSLPNERQNIFSLASEVYEVDSVTGEEKPVAPEATELKKERCTPYLNRFLGVELCSKTSLSKALQHGWLSADIELVKTDRTMSGWEFGLELPSGRNTNFRASFQTPRSTINRRVSLEAEVINHRGLRVHIESPIKTVEVTTSYELDAEQVNYKIMALVDRSDKYSFEAGVKRISSGRKAEFVPVFRLTSPSTRPFGVTGSIILEKGRKSQLTFDLKTENNDRKYIKGSLIREGFVSIDKDFKLSSDVQAELGFLSMRVFGQGEKKDLSLSSDFKVDYQAANSRKHSLKLTGKLQNLSAAGQTKVNSFVEVQSSQFPSKNMHVSWNIVSKAHEKMENEVTIMWDGKMDNPAKKIHVLQSSKATGLRSGKTMTTDNLLSVEIAPINFKYDLKVSGHIEKSQSTPKYKINVEVNNRNQKDGDVMVTFEYDHISASPLKMAVEAAIILPSGEIKYQDNIEEIASRTFKGKTQLQWHQDRKTTIDYTLKVRNNENKVDLELDSELKTPSMTFGLHHHGLLRVTRSQFELLSKMNHEKNNVWELKADLNKKAKSTLQLVTRNFNGKMETVHIGSAKTANLEIQGDNWSHNTNFVASKDAVTLSSKTLDQQRPIFVLNARKSNRDSTRFNLESSLLDTKIEYNPKTPVKTASFEINQKFGEQVVFKIRSSLRSQNEVEVSVEGKSASIQHKSADLKLKRQQNELEIEVLSKENGREWISTRASYALKDNLRITFQCSNQGQEVTRFNGKFDRQPFEGPHDMEIFYLRKGSKHAISAHHEIANRQIQSSISHNKDGQQIREAQIVLRGNNMSTQQANIVADLKVKCMDKSLEAHVSHQHSLRRDGVEATCEGKAVLNGRKNYEAKIVAQADKTGKASLKAECKTPKKNWEQQAGEMEVQWDNNRVKFDARVQNSQKKDLKVSVEASKMQGDKLYRVNADLKSDFKKVIPSVAFEGQMDLDKKTAFLTARHETQEVLKVEGNGDFKNYKEFRGQLVGKTSQTPRYTIALEGKKNGKEILYTIDVAQDGQKVLSAQASHEKMSGFYRNTVRITSEKDISDITFQSNLNKNLALGPHDIECSVNILGAPKRVFQAHHEINNGQVKEVAKYLVAGEERSSFMVNGNYRRERNIFSVELSSEAKSPSFSSLQHDSLFRFGQGVADLTSKMTKDGQQIYDAKSHWSVKDKSYVIVDSEVFQGKLAVDPFDQEKSALLEWTTRRFQHVSEAKINQKREISLKSKTTRDQRELVNLDSLLKYNVYWYPEFASIDFVSNLGKQIQYNRQVQYAY